MVHRALRRLRQNRVFSLTAITATGLAAGILSVLFGVEQAARPSIQLPAVERIVVFHISSSAGTTQRLTTGQWQVIRDLPFIENAFAYSIWPVMAKDRELSVALVDGRNPSVLDLALVSLTSDGIVPSRLLEIPSEGPLELNGWRPNVSARTAPSAFPLEPSRAVHAWTTVGALPALESSASFNDPNSGTVWLTVAAWVKEGIPLSSAAEAATRGLHGAGTLAPERKVVMVPVRAWDPPNASVPRPLLQAIRAMGLLVVISLAATVSLMGLLRTLRESSSFSTEVRLGAQFRHLAIPRLVDWGFIAAGGAVLAFLVAPVLTSLLVATVPAGAVVRPRNGGVSAAAFGCLAAALVTLPALGYGLLMMRSRRLQNATNSYGQTGRGTRKVFGIVLFAQFAVAAVLIAAAVVLGRTLSFAQQVDPGFTPRGAVVAGIRPSQVKDKVSYETVLQTLRADPAIRHVSFVADVPLGDSAQFTTVTSGSIPGSRIRSFMTQAGPDVVTSLGARLLAGRDLQDSDLGRPTGAAVVNASLARQLAGGAAQSIGIEITVRQSQFIIVGVVDDGKYVQLTESVSPFAYLTYRKDNSAPTNLIVRGQSAAVGPLDDLLRGYFDQYGWPQLGRVTPLATLVDKWLGPISSILTATRWLVPLVLLMSFYGVLSVTAVVLVSGSREVAIREAVGATHFQAMHQHVGPYCRLALVGGGVGLMLVVALGRVASAMLFGANPLDPRVLGVTTITILITLVCGVGAAMMAYWKLPSTLTLELRQ